MQYLLHFASVDVKKLNDKVSKTEAVLNEF